MGIKEKLLTSIKEANESTQVWMDQVQLLSKGKATHLVQVPVNHAESNFGVWLNTEKQVITSFSEYENISEIHENFHDAYKEVFNKANEVFDNDSHKNLQSAVSKFEGQFILFSSKLKGLESAFKCTSESILEEYSAKTKDTNTEICSVENKVVEEQEVIPETDNDKLIENNVVDSVNKDLTKLSLDPSEIHKRLKEQDLHQIQLEQKLTEQELNQLEERLLLTNQSVMQIAQYQELKKQEVDMQMNAHLLLEANNSDDREISYQAITKLIEDILVKEGEIGKFTLVDKKINDRQAERIEKEQKIHDTFAKEQKSNTESIVQFDEQQEKWESEVKKLKQQLSLIELDLRNLSQHKAEKQSLIDRSDEMKQIQLDDLRDYYKKQEDLNGQKAKTKELKQAELSELERQLEAKEKEVDCLEADATVLKAKKDSINLKYEQDLKQLDEQQKFKRITIERLEQDKARKNQELKELSSQKELLQNGLREEAACSQNSKPRNLEEV